MSSKKILTTGEVAEYCGVHFRTVIRWIQNGKLKAYQLPGRGDNRVRVSDFITFLHANNLPIPEELSPKEKTVLVVDDERSITKSLSRLIERAGYKTLVANDGFSAGALLMEHKPQAMTLDLRMPMLDGFGVLAYIKEHPELQSLKVLVLSAERDDVLLEAKKQGAHEALSKPFNNTEVLQTIEALIGPTN